MREDADPDLASAVGVTREDDTGAFDLAVGEIGSFESLEPPLPELDGIALGGNAFVAEAMRAAVFNALWL